MKKLIIIAALALPMSASFAATAVCAPGVAPTPVAPDPAKFIQNGISAPKCSQNVNLQFNQGAIAVAVGANSIKGKNTFAGSTLGGQVAAFKQCAAACKDTEAAGAADDIVTAASL